MLISYDKSPLFFQIGKTFLFDSIDRFFRWINDTFYTFGRANHKSKMELRQLKYFLKAQELLSFTEAAKHLNISQSTLSQQIKQLETELDVSLFNRIGKQITLTEPGRLFTEYAEQSVRKAEDGKLMLQDLKKIRVGTVTIGVAYGLKDFFVETLIKFSELFPQIKIKVIYEPSHSLYEKLQQAQVDFVLALHETEIVPYFIYKNLFSCPMVLAALAGTEVSCKTSISLEEICKLPLVIATMGYDMTHTVHRAFSAKGLIPKFTIEVNDIPTAIRLVNSGNWYSIFIKTSVLGTTLASVAIRDDGLMRYAKIISLKGTYETESVKEFKKMLTISAKTLKLS
jgi:DNA-binding transcriptional LysR family regulator